jgi:hypothetical protein
MMFSSEEKLARLRSLCTLAQTAEEFDDGVTLEEDLPAVTVGNWALIAFNEEDELGISFHLDAHPNAVARLTRYLIEHGIAFALHEAFTIDDDDQIVFESDLGAPPNGIRPDGSEPPA